MKQLLILTKPISISLIALLFLVISCGKEKSLTTAQEEEMAQVSSESSGEAENTFSETFDDVMGVNNEVGIAGSGVFYGRVDSLSPAVRCFSVTIIRLSNTPFPVKVIVDFGNTGCIGPDGHKRRGKIITTYTDRLTNPGAVATTVFENFYVDSVHVEGTHKVSNTSEPPNILRRYKVQVIDGKMTKPSGNFIEWNSTRSIMQIEGVATADPRDDVYKIYDGTASGRVRRGNLIVRWESTITEPLIRRVTCRWIVKGIIRTVRVNLPGNSPWVSLLNFGNGICDNLATLTVNGRTQIITLP
jgi:hypothetical protein